MPDALKIFLVSLFSGLTGGYVTLRIGSWVVQHFFPSNPIASYVLVLLVPAIGVATAVTTGVIVGRDKR